MQSPAQNENVGQVENLLRVLEARHAATQEQSLNALSRQGHSTRTNTGWLVHFKRVLVRCSFEHRLSYKEAHFIPPLPCLRLLAFYSIGNRIQSLLLSPQRALHNLAPSAYFLILSHCRYFRAPLPSSLASWVLEIPQVFNLLVLGMLVNGLSSWAATLPYLAGSPPWKGLHWSLLPITFYNPHITKSVPLYYCLFSFILTRA